MQKAALAIAKQDIDRLARLINDLLDISKIEAGRMELKKSSVVISSLAEKCSFPFRAKREEAYSAQDPLKENVTLTLY